MIENKPIFITVNIGDINQFQKDYELVQLYTDTTSLVMQQSATILGSQGYIPVVQTYSNTKALMKLKRTQEILYGETK